MKRACNIFGEELNDIFKVAVVFTVFFFVPVLTVFLIEIVNSETDFEYCDSNYSFTGKIQGYKEWMDYCINNR